MPLLSMAMNLALTALVGNSKVSSASAAPLGSALPRQEDRASPLPNASFERQNGDAPERWFRSRWGGQGEHSIADFGHTGTRSVCIASQDGADIGWSVRVPVRMRSTYRLSGWIKTENVETRGGAHGALFNLHDLQPVATPAVVGSEDWTRVEVEFATGVHDSVQINCLFGGWGLATGRAWYDDVRLELLASEEWSPQVQIDATQTGAPLSKYVYGQFIEHLGRCIQGGIWAEMLEDRKFFDPVGEGESPWRALGGTVVMQEGDAFVGAHSPRIVADGGGEAGLVQGDLGVVEGKEYVGRIWAQGDASCGPLEVRLVWGTAREQRAVVTIPELAPEFRPVPLRFVAGARTDRAELEIVTHGSGSFRIGTASLMPADHVDGLRADTLALLRELDAPVYRWPGGNFVSGYDWKDGVGERDRRPPRKNPAWRGVESNDFGIDEFLAFCSTLGTDAYIAVNAGLGEVESAVQELQYANGGDHTPMGAQRAAHGHPEAYAVRFWGIGNEMYGDWQLGHMPLDAYVHKHLRFAEALRAEDPSVVLVAVGAIGPWSEGMLQGAADHMDFMSEHFYCQEGSGLAGHVFQVPQAVRRIADAHREYRQRLTVLESEDIRIALDEWNYWYGPQVFGELGTRYFLKDALGIAAGLHEIARNSDLFAMANYAQTVNVIGAIKTTRTAACFATTGLVLKLYRQHFGTIPVRVTASPPLDAMAAFSDDRRTLTVGVVNATLEAMELPLELTGVTWSGGGRCWTIAGDDPMLYDEPGVPPRVEIVESAVLGATDRLRVPACSVTLFELPVTETAQHAP